MIRFLKYVVLAVIAVILLLFAFANREIVTVSFDPFGSSDNAALAITAPLFAVVTVFAMLGVVAGAFATWLSQGRHRRASRQNRAEADKWRTEAETLRATQPSPPTLPRH
jgi:uncharacterized integral membrane protein